MKTIRFPFFSLSLFVLCLSYHSFLYAGQEIQINIEKKEETFIVKATSKLPVPLQIAWEVMTDFDKMSDMLDNLSISKIKERKGNVLIVQQEGTVRYGIFSYNYATEREIRLDPTRRIASKQLSGNARRYESVMELSGDDATSQARYYAEIILESGVASSFGGSFIEHEIEEEFTAFYAEMKRRVAAKKGNSQATKQ